MITTGSFLIWVAVCGALWWVLSYQSDAIPVHDPSKRYQELRKRPDEEEAMVVRSFRYRKNAEKWMSKCDRFRGTLQLVDSKTHKVIYTRRID